MAVFQLIGELDHHERTFRASSSLLCHDSILILMENQTSRWQIMRCTRATPDNQVLFVIKDNKDISKSFMLIWWNEKNIYLWVNYEAR